MARLFEFGQNPKNKSGSAISRGTRPLCARYYVRVGAALLGAALEALLRYQKRRQIYWRLLLARGAATMAASPPSILMVDVAWGLGVSKKTRKSIKPKKPEKK